jgi:N-acetylmuramoyl-L-alanine amidase
MARIVIDPGHGGARSIPNDSTWNNAVGPGGTLEKNLVLDIALRARDALIAKGHRVEMTRSTDVNLRLKARAQVAKAIKAHAFVSIHFNASIRHNAQGTETLVTPQYSGASARLSLVVQDAVLAVTGLTDRNKAFDRATRIKPQSLAVLRPSSHDSGTAACLVEVSFLDREDEERRLQDERYRARIAMAIANGVDAYVGTTHAKAAAERGDAIEIAAAESGPRVSVPAFLGLTRAAGAGARGDAPETIDDEERVVLPKVPFSRAFLTASGPENALIRNAPSWPDLADFEKMIAKLKLEHFKADEFLELGGQNTAGKCRGLNTFPPRNLWPNIQNTALMLDAIRAEIGAAIRVLSVYRSPEYNTCVKGEKNSLHTRFNAIDFTCEAGSPEVWRRIAARVRSSDKRFLGGIGVYPKRNFLHIDTRGRAANWTGK